MRNGVRPSKPSPPTNERPEIEASSGNVFADLEVPHPEEMLAKAELALRIGTILSEQRLTQAKAAALLGIDRASLAALSRGKLEDFSTERLFRFLNLLGQDVDIVVRPRRRGDQQGATRVVPA